MQNNKRETQSEKLASITLAFSFTQQKLTFRDLGVPKKKSALSAVLKSIPAFPTPKKRASRHSRHPKRCAMVCNGVQRNIILT